MGTTNQKSIIDTQKIKRKESQHNTKGITPKEKEQRKKGQRTITKTRKHSEKWQ